MIAIFKDMLSERLWAANEHYYKLATQVLFYCFLIPFLALTLCFPHQEPSYNHLEPHMIYVMSATIFPTSRGEQKNHFEWAGLESRSSCLAVDLSNHLTTAPRSIDIMINCYTVCVLASERKFSRPGETLKVFLEPLKLLKSWFMKTLRHGDWTFELLERWKSLPRLQTSANTLQGTLGQILRSLVVEQAWTRSQTPGQNYWLAVKKPQAVRIVQWIAFLLCTQRPRVQFLAFPRSFLNSWC